MATLRSIILDDEADARDLLESLLQEECPGLVEVLAKVEDIPSAVHAIAELKPELVFLDIKLRAAQSFELFDHYPKPDFGVVFITGYEKYALRGFKFAALHYLLKPIDREELKEAVGRAMLKKHEIMAKIDLMRANQVTNNSRIALVDKDGLEIREIADIGYIRADGNYSVFYFVGGKSKIVSKTLKNFEDLLVSDLERGGNYHFSKCHRSYIINLRFVTRLRAGKKGGRVTLREFGEIEVSESRIAELRRRLELI